MDVIPYPFKAEDWEDTRKFYVLWGHFQAASARLGIEVRWGGDWDRDGSFRDQSFHDLPHIELVATYEAVLGNRATDLTLGLALKRNPPGLPEVL